MTVCAQDKVLLNVIHRYLRKVKRVKTFDLQRNKQMSISSIDVYNFLLPLHHYKQILEFGTLLHMNAKCISSCKIIYYRILIFAHAFHI